MVRITTEATDVCSNEYTKVRTFKESRLSYPADLGILSRLDRRNIEQSVNISGLWMLIEYEMKSNQGKKRKDYLNVKLR